MQLPVVTTGYCSAYGFDIEELAHSEPSHYILYLYLYNFYYSAELPTASFLACCWSGPTDHYPIIIRPSG